MNSDEKKALRKIFIKRRESLSIDDVEVKSKAITKRLLKVVNDKVSRNVFVYISFNKEVQTKEIINSLILKNSVYVPFYDKNRGRYALCKFTKCTDLSEGPFGIYQPKNIKEQNADIVDLAIIPGVAFSKDGVRLGFGKGVYDTLLSGSGALKIGLAYDFQIVDRLPAERHDLVMDMVITEKRIIRVSRS